MLPIIERIAVTAIFNRNVRYFGAITAPQLMRIVNDLDSRVYRPHILLSSAARDVRLEVDEFKVKLADKLSTTNNDISAFGNLASRADKLPTIAEESNLIKRDGPEKFNDHHLRLSKTGRKHDISWYLGRIYRLCKAGDTKGAVHMFFHQMLTVDRVMPDRNVAHVLLSGLAEVGDSESAYKVYSKMTELGITATNSTYSRLFKACAEDIAAFQREHRYTLQPPANSPISSQSDLAFFAGPALERAKGLWLRLHERGFRMNRITYNTLLLALGKGGDLQGCFQALDAMLLGEGGLPPPLITATKPTHLHGHTTSSNPLPPFRPDAYTLAAVLTAVQQSHKSGRIASPVEALRLALHVWQLIIPRLPRGQRPGLHNFTLMAGILGLSATKNQKRFSLPSPRGLHKNAKSLPVSNFIEVIPESLPRLGTAPPPVSPRLLTSEKAASALLQRVALLAAGEEKAAIQRPPHDTTTSSTIALTTHQCDKDVKSVATKSVASRLMDINWSDPNVVVVSPINLLLPLPPEGVHIPLPPKDTYPSHFHSCLPPWQRLALCGGLMGFLDCIQSHFKVSEATAPQIITKLASLLPPPESSATSALDQWETAFLSAMEKHKVVLDLPIFNSLLQRRTAMGLPTSELMAVANRQGISPDEFTWGCFARSCRTSRDVRDFLTSYSEAAASSAVSSTGDRRGDNVRPSLHVYATLFSATTYYWDAKIVIIRSMAGGSLTSKKKTKTNFDEVRTDDAIPPNRRILANLEMEIANYRDLVTRGVVPKDGSSVGGCEATAGHILPKFSLRAFKKFLPVYKSWVEETVVLEGGVEDAAKNASSS